MDIWNLSSVHYFQCCPTALYLFYNVPDVFKRWYCWSWLQTFQLLTPTRLQQSQAVGIFVECGLALSPMSSTKKKCPAIMRSSKDLQGASVMCTHSNTDAGLWTVCWMFPFLITQWTWHLWFPNRISRFDPADQRMVF